MITNVVAKTLRRLCTANVLFSYAKTSKAQQNDPSTHNRTFHIPPEQKDSKHFKSEKPKE